MPKSNEPTKLQAMLIIKLVQGYRISAWKTSTGVGVAQLFRPDGGGRFVPVRSISTETLLSMRRKGLLQRSEERGEHAGVEWERVNWSLVED